MTICKRLLGTPCNHCKKVQATQARGLCWRCYADPALRERYPLLGPRRRNYGNGSRGTSSIRQSEVKPARQATTARPGSEEKVKEMIERLKRGEELYHPEDGEE